MISTLNDCISSDHMKHMIYNNCFLTVYFIQDKLISGEVQFSQVEVGDVCISLLQTKTHKCQEIIFLYSPRLLTVIIFGEGGNKFYN